MPRTSKKLSSKRITKKQIESARVSRSRDRDEDQEDRADGIFDKIQYDLQHNQSYLNLILGGLIIVVLAVLIYNYFNKPDTDLGPAQETVTQTETSGDVAKENLPGQYTVKVGDTLFSIAQNYYNDGYKYTELMTANGLANENLISEGQVLEIPRLEEAMSAEAEASPEAEQIAEASIAPTESPEASPMASDGTALTSPQTQDDLALTQNEQPTVQDTGTGGAENQTIWGEKIIGDTYTVQAGDWLSKIAGRAYGDIYAYEKIAKENNLANPDSIEVGMTLKIPR